MKTKAARGCTSRKHINRQRKLYKRKNDGKKGGPNYAISLKGKTLLTQFRKTERKTKTERREEISSHERRGVEKAHRPSGPGDAFLYMHGGNESGGKAWVTLSRRDKTQWKFLLECRVGAGKGDRKGSYRQSNGKRKKVEHASSKAQERSRERGRNKDLRHLSNVF